MALRCPGCMVVIALVRDFKFCAAHYFRSKTNSLPCKAAGFLKSEFLQIQHGSLPSELFSVNLNTTGTSSIACKQWQEHRRAQSGTRGLFLLLTGFGKKVLHCYQLAPQVAQKFDAHFEADRLAIITWSSLSLLLLWLFLRDCLSPNMVMHLLGNIYNRRLHHVSPEQRVISGAI